MVFRQNSRTKKSAENQPHFKHETEKGVHKSAVKRQGDFSKQSASKAVAAKTAVKPMKSGHVKGEKLHKVLACAGQGSRR